MEQRLKGIIPPIVTLFDQHGEIDWKANQALVDWLIDQRVHGLLLMGSTGEFSALTNAERKEYAEKMTAYVNGRVPVLIGTGSTAFKEVIDLATHAQSVGADGILVVNPYYWNYSEEQLYDYYAKISQCVSIPVIIYNIPLLTGQCLSAELIHRLAVNHKNIIGVKDTINDIGHIRQLLITVKKDRPDFLIFSAFDDHLLPSLQIGAAGSINGIANFAPELFVQLYEHYQSGNIQAAIELHKQIVQFMSIYDYSTPFYTAIKEAVNQRVLKRSTGARFPIETTDDELKNNVKEFLLSNKLIQ